MQADYLKKSPTTVIFKPDREKEPHHERQSLEKVRSQLDVAHFTTS